MHAVINGKTAFLAPPIDTVPFNLLGPFIKNLSIYILLIILVACFILSEVISSLLKSLAISFILLFLSSSSIFATILSSTLVLKILYCESLLFEAI